MSSPQNASLARVAAYLRANILKAGGRRLGRFVVLLDPASPEPFLNYAFPDDSIDPDDAELDELVAAFEEADRIPRLEYIADFAPRLRGRLESRGFEAETEASLLGPIAHPPAIEVGVPIELRSAEATEDLRGASRLLHEAFGAPEPVEADLERLQGILGRGGALGIARATDVGQDVGAGILTGPIEGTAEIAGVGVLAGFRGRGVGAAVTAYLGRVAVERGLDLPFVMTEPENEGRVYRRAGFVPFGRILHISRKGLRRAP